MVICRVDDELELRLLEHQHSTAIDGLQAGDLSSSQGEWGEWSILPGGGAEWVTIALEEFAKGTRLEAGIFRKNELLGVIALHHVDRRRETAEIDYAMDSRYRNHGIMTRACSALLKHAFAQLGLHRIQICTDTANRASRRVPEKLGFTQEGILRSYYHSAGGFRDCALYSMLKDEWDQTRVGARRPARPRRSIDDSPQIDMRYMQGTDARRLRDAFTGTPWDRGLAFFEELARLHESRTRKVWVGLAGADPVAFGSLVPDSAYPPFRELGIPEIQDLNVSPRYRRRGIASAILDAAERVAFERSDRVGIGFGLHPGYGAAQRLYVLRGYVPDGRGVFCRGDFPREGEHVELDDELVLYLVKRRPGTP